MNKFNQLMNQLKISENINAIDINGAFEASNIFYAIYMIKAALPKTPK